tara:strand:- start:43104 stop:43550 length:447 start_codon:yes stop_codon:yes gene_type:complete
MTKREALEKMKKYCAYQERCQSELRQKLYILKVNSEDIDNILCHLIEENFLNEERFAKNFVRGKFRQKNWGKIKINQHLKQKGISDYCIKKGFKEINQEEYLKTLDVILLKKSKVLIEENPFIKKQKLAKYAINKGFENNLVWDLLRD